MKWKMPPKAKVYEALSAVVDGRVMVVSAGEATVTSSGGDKSYKVTWSEDLSAFASNDNASKFQGYIGYPIIAVMLQLGVLSFDPASVGALKDVPWKRLNDQFKRDYDRVVEHVLSSCSDEERALVHGIVEDIYRELERLPLERYSRSSRI